MKSHVERSGLFRKLAIGCFVGVAMLSMTSASAQQRDASADDKQRAAADQPADNQMAPYLGVAVDEVPPALAAQLGDRLEQEQGVLVAEVAAGSPAEKAGIQAHDVLIRYGGQNLTSPSQLVSLVRNDKVGSEIELQILRGGESQQVAVTLGERPASTTAERQRSMPELPPWFSRRVPGDAGQAGDRASVWTSFESLSLESLHGDRYRVEISYLNDEGATERRTYEGTREEIRSAIVAQKELPDDKRRHLLDALDLAVGGGPARFDFPEGFELPDDSRMFQDLREFEEALRQRLQRDF